MYRVAHINGKKTRIEETENIDKLKIKKGEFVWIDARAKKISDLQALKKRFKLHKLAVEDCVAAQERAKLEKFPGYNLILIKVASFEKKLEIHRLSIFVGKDFILTISKNEHKFIKSAMEELNETGVELAGMSADSVAYLLIDRVVDMYFPVLESIEAEIEAIETKILSSVDKNTLKKIFRVKKDLLTFRKSVWPVREMASALARDPNYSNKELGPYYRDINDHVVLIMDLVESYRDMLSNAMESYLSSVSNSTNDVMKILTVISTIFIPLTFITGLYGMNFHWMPEINSAWGLQYGYFYALLLMLTVGLLTTAYFRKKKWI